MSNAPNAGWVSLLSCQLPRAMMARVIGVLGLVATGFLLFILLTSDQEVLDFLVSRYGDFVRYRPPFKPSTWLPWASPFLFTGIGLGALTWYVRRRRVETPLSVDDKAKAAALLAEER